MHPFTEERIRQDYEYEQALLADIAREKLEEERNAQLEAQKEEEEASDTSSDAPPPLTIEEMRAKRLQFFSSGQSGVAEDKEVKKASIQCAHYTRKGLRCKKRAKECNLCHIHLRFSGLQPQV